MRLRVSPYHGLLSYIMGLMPVIPIIQIFTDQTFLAKKTLNVSGSSLLTRPDFKGNSGLLNSVTFLVRSTGKHQYAN